jgi:hypothetical protein
MKKNKSSKKSPWSSKKGASLFTEIFPNWKDTFGYEWNKNITPYYNRVLENENERAYTLLAAMLLEYQTDVLLNSYISDYKALGSLQMAFKLRLIKSFNLIPTHFIEFAEIVVKIRNVFAHNIEIDTFDEMNHLSDAATIKLLKRLYQVRSQYEDVQMSHFKLDPSIKSQFHDLWRVALMAFHDYTRNIEFFVNETRNPEFIEKLLEESKIKEIQRNKKM